MHAGKVVYNAHLTYALEHYAGEFPQKVNVYAFLKEKGQPHKKYHSQSVYREATAISREKAQGEVVDSYGLAEADETKLDVAMAEASARLVKENLEIVEADKGETGWERLKGKLRKVGKWFTDNRKEVMRAGAVATVVVALSIFGSRSLKDWLNEADSNLPKVVQIVPPVKEAPTSGVYPPASVQEWGQRLNTGGEKIPTPIVDEASGLAIPQEVLPAEVPEWDQRAPREKPQAPLTVEESPDEEAAVNNLAKYIAKTEAEAIALAQGLDFIGPESPYEHPSNMCGPLAASVLRDLQVLPAGFEINPSSFWLANPQRLDRLLPQPAFQKIAMNQSVDSVDFDWRVGDFVYLQGGDFDHMVTISRVDSAGKVFAISNFKNPDGRFVVEEYLLSDPSDPEAGLFKEWPRPDRVGRTGMSGVYVWRVSESLASGTRNVHSSTSFKGS